MVTMVTMVTMVSMDIADDDLTIIPGEDHTTHQITIVDGLMNIQDAVQVIHLDRVPQPH